MHMKLYTVTKSVHTGPCDALPVDCTGCGWAARHRYPGWVGGVWGRHTHPVHFPPCHTHTLDQPAWEQPPERERERGKQLHYTVCETVNE